MIAVHYQVAILGPAAAEHSEKLENKVREFVRGVSLELDGHLEFISPEQWKIASNKCPVVAIYFCSDVAVTEDDEALEHLLAVSDVIIPVVDREKNFREKCPALLQDINGHELVGDPGLDKLANLTLENLGLVRRSRRIFISYRRAESADVANQLRDLFDDCGFDVFLDTRSVPPGDVFQDVLFQRLADSDIVVLLDTPGFLESDWTPLELAEAAAMCVTILQLVWPGVTRVEHSRLCDPYYLETGDFDGTKLNDATGKRIAEHVERLRARSTAARHDNLVGEYCKVASRLGIPTTVQPQQHIESRRKDGTSIVAVPAIGVLDANRFHEATLKFPDRVDQLLLIYESRGLRSSWRRYLTWLNDHLPVKAVRVGELEERLRGTV